LIRLAIVAAPVLVLLWPSAPMAVRGVAALAILWTPGWLLVGRLLPHERDLAIGLVLRVCGGVAVHCVLLLWLVPVLAASGALLITTICLLVSVGLALLPTRQKPRSRPRGLPRRRELAAWGLVLLIAVALRLPHLGAAEFHDDEASVALAAAHFAQGDAEVLLLQLKGPAQILLPTGPLLLTGQLSELTARLPFSLAGFAVVLGGMALTRQLVGRGLAPLVAGLVLALDGLLIAFARIVQYQSLVLVLSLGAYWCCWRFARGAPDAWRHLSLAALFAAVALLGHWDAIYVLPALLWLVVLGTRRRRWSLQQAARPLAGPVLIGAALLIGFYVPFVRHPHVAETLEHLSERTGQGSGWRLVNNLGANYDLMTVYNTPAQVWAVALLIVGLVFAVVFATAYPRHGTRAWWHERLRHAVLSTIRHLATAALVWHRVAGNGLSDR
jgi:hypothetical protein